MERKNKKTKSVGNGEGSLYYSDTLQCWIFQYVVNEKRKTLKQKKKETVKEFKARVTKTKNDINMNTYVENSNITLYDILSDYIENKHFNGIISDRTYNRDLGSLKLLERCCNLFIRLPIQKVTISHIKKSLPNFVELKTPNCANENDYKIYSQNVINKLYLLLNKGFKIATSERIILYNIMDNASLQKPKSKKISEKVEALTIEEEKKLVNILKSTNHKYNKIILLTLSIGTRIGESLAISRHNINLNKNTLIINNTLTRDKDDKVILGCKTKTLAGKREIFLSHNAIEILKDILKDNITNIYDLIFFDYEKNTFITPNEVNCYLKRLNQKYHICKNLHTHMLRHTYATRCIEAGMSAKVLQKNLGHKKIQTTLDTYTSIFEKFNKDENEKYNLYMKEIGI